MKDEEFTIYSITCKATGGCYVGRTQDYERRIKEHLRDLRNGNHYSSRMQEDFFLYGEDSFEFNIEKTFKGKNFIWEQKVYDNKAKNHLMYNFRPQVNGVPEIILNNLENKQGMYWVTNGKEDHFIAIGDTLPEGFRLGRSKGSPNFSEEIRKKMQGRRGKKNGFFGKHHSEEYKKKKSELQKERLENPENHPMYGKHHSEETKFKISISKKALSLSKKININAELLKAVFEAITLFGEGKVFAVGGCVRDSLLRRDIKDIDLATELLPDNVEEILKRNNYHVWTVGKKFGTLSYKSKVCDYIVEVTTYRSEKYTPGSRKPEVKFGTDLKEDLKRRDFTINSLAFDGNEIIDLFAGELDLNHKLIKSVGEPKQMINDDPLRILRAIRFSVQLDFDIEQNLERHLRRFCTKLFDVAIERQLVELDKMFSIDAEKSLEKLYSIGYIKYFLPEIMGDENLKMKIPSSINNHKTEDELWKQILSQTGEEVVYSEIGEITVTNSQHKRTRFLNRGIAARFKFSNKRRQIVTGDK